MTTTGIHIEARVKWFDTSQRLVKLVFLAAPLLGIRRSERLANAALHIVRPQFRVRGGKWTAIPQVELPLITMEQLRV